MNDIPQLNELSAADTDDALDKIADLLERNSDIDDFRKKLVSSIDSIPYESISYVISSGGEGYRLEVLYDTGSNEVEKHNMRDLIFP